MHELSHRQRDRRTRPCRHADGRRVTVGDACASGALRQVVPDSLEFYFEIVARDTVCEGARLEQELVGGPAALRGAAATSGSPWCRPFRVPRRAERPTSRCSRGDELEVESIEIEEEEACIAPR